MTDWERKLPEFFKFSLAAAFLMIVSYFQLVRKHLVNMGDTFLYFGFGSNLLKERIHISNPSAKFVCTAKLKVYVSALSLFISFLIFF